MADVLALAIDPEDPERLYAGSPDGRVFVTTRFLNCPGDCDGNHDVTVDEIMIVVNDLLNGTQSPMVCMLGDRDQDGSIRLTEVVAAVQALLHGCTDCDSDEEL